MSEVPVKSRPPGRVIDLLDTDLVREAAQVSVVGFSGGQGSWGGAGETVGGCPGVKR